MPKAVLQEWWVSVCTLPRAVNAGSKGSRGIKQSEMNHASLQTKKTAIFKKKCWLENNITKTIMRSLVFMESLHPYVCGPAKTDIYGCRVSINLKYLLLRICGPSSSDIYDFRVFIFHTEIPGTMDILSLLVDANNIWHIPRSIWNKYLIFSIYFNTHSAITFRIGYRSCV